MYNRNLRKPNPNKNIYKFISAKNKTSIMCESGLENDVCFLFECNANVLSYQSQPRGFSYINNGRECFYTPDFLVEYTDLTKEFFEVKPFTRANEPEFVQKFNAIKVAAQQNKTPISLITDRQIHIQPRLDNAKLLYRYAGVKSLNLPQHSIVSFISKSWQSQFSVKELSIKLNLSQGEINSNLLALLSAGIIQSDMENQAFGDDLLVWAV